MVHYLKNPPTLFCDKSYCIISYDQPHIPCSTKHIEIDYKFIREKVVNGILVKKYVLAKDQLVDLFTKDTNIYFYVSSD